jgi:hypothetical protein
MDSTAPTLRRTKMSRRVKRRTIFDTPAKGKIKWLPRNLYMLFIIHNGEDFPIKKVLHTAQLGLDKDGNLVDALYRTLKPISAFEDSDDHYAQLDISGKKFRTISVAHPIDGDIEAQAKALAERYEQHYEKVSKASVSDLWHAPAGIRRGTTVSVLTYKDKEADTSEIWPD